MKTLPAIIPENIEELESSLLMVKGLVKNVQIDICDGRLTPAPSWPYINEYGEMKEILGQERGLPLWDAFDFEIDLMVLNPKHDYEQWIDAGASGIIFHYDEKLAEVLKEIISNTKDRGVRAGLALGVDTPIAVLKDFKDIIDSVQLMGIKQIGFQGQPFEESVIAKVAQVKEKYPDLIVSIDGGVNFETAPKLAEAGVDVLVVGSAIFNQGDVPEAVFYFKSLGH